MKPFDLGKAKSGHPVCTRDGHKARIACYDYDGIEGKPIIALIEEGDYERAVALNNNGKLYSDDDSGNDLMMASVKHEGWVNVYQYAIGHYSTGLCIYPCEEDAKNYAKEAAAAYIAAVKIEWEE